LAFSGVGCAQFSTSTLFIGHVPVFARSTINREP